MQQVEMKLCLGCNLGSSQALSSSFRSELSGYDWTARPQRYTKLTDEIFCRSVDDTYDMSGEVYEDMHEGSIIFCDATICSIDAELTSIAILLLWPQALSNVSLVSLQNLKPGLVHLHHNIRS